MTHPTYTQQALSRYNLPRLKRIAVELGVTPTGDKRAAQTWVNAIITHQFTQLQKVDNQALAQAELDNYIADQAQAIAPEPLTIVEISFDHHEYYADDKLVASISHDNNHLTQPWVVMVNEKEVFRANTPMRCDRFICTHYKDGKDGKDGSLPVQEQLATPCATGNEVMAQIFNQRQNYGYEILNDGIYNNNIKLGEVGQTDSNWWLTRATDETQRIACDSAMDVVQPLSMVNVSTDSKSIFDEYFLEQPLEQLTGNKLQRLLERAELVTA
ncbi:hypothetical protein [Nostoc sp. CALU 546]|uniref:hypothetical protein n=1 Tax=Nostoc sp. CALU 546 TaxID=1867241 RepID=UPI003B671462